MAETLVRETLRTASTNAEIGYTKPKIQTILGHDPHFVLSFVSNSRLSLIPFRARNFCSV